MQEPRIPAVGANTFGDIFLSTLFLFLSIFFFLNHISLKSWLKSRRERGHEGEVAVDSWR